MRSDFVKTTNIVKGAMFIALGVLLPQAFHLAGGGGPVFLPMHIPVLLAGFLAGPITGLYVGILTPILSHLVTGMPPVAPIPMLPIMIFELSTYGLIAGILYNKLRLNVFISLIGAMLAGRAAYGLTVYFIITLFSIKMPLGPIAAVVVAVKTGIIGIILQIIVVPILVKLLEGEFINVRSDISSK